MSTLVQVVFVGGPLHGTRTLMANPEFKMAMETSSGEAIEYCRRMVEAGHIDGVVRQVVTYSPTGLSEHEFARLAVEVAKDAN